jgi:hypothetical protein
VILDEARMHVNTHTKHSKPLFHWFKECKNKKQKVFQKTEHVCRSVSLDNQGHSPHPRGEDLLRQLYDCDGHQYGIQHLEAWTSTNSRHRHHLKEEKRRNLHTKVIKQSLSDYAQQDLSKVTKRSPLDMQRF